MCIIKSYILPGKSGEFNVVIQRQRYAFKDNATSCIISNLPSYLSLDANAEPHPSPSKSQKRIQETFEKQQTEWMNKDKIQSFKEFLRDLDTQLKRFGCRDAVQKKN